MIEVFKPFQMPALISAGILFLSYVIITFKMFGIPKSISWTYYLLKDSNNKRGLWKREYWFQLFIYILSAFIIVAGNNIYFLLAGLSLSIVGLAPTVKDKVLFKFHLLGAIMSIGLCLFDLYTVNMLIHLIIILVCSILFVLQRVKWVITYIEVFSFLTIFIYLFKRLW